MSFHFFGGQFFGSGFFGEGADVAVKTGTGGIDPEKRRRKTIYKPTGLAPRPKSRIEERVEDAAQIHAEVIEAARQEFSPDAPPVTTAPATLWQPVEHLSAAQIDAEIAFLMKEKMRRDEDDATAIILLTVAAL